MSLRSNLSCMLLIASSTAWSVVSAQTPMPLYEGEIPGAIAAPDQESLRDPNEVHLFYQDVSRPLFYPYPLTKRKAPTAAVVIFPGGGYRGVSMIKEGHDVARQLNAYGIAAFVVKYRTPSDAHMRDKSVGPLQDAQQALRLVRQRAGEWNIDPKRVGVMGFSAGGHLAASAATRYSQPVLERATAEQVRPDFSMLIYPVISFDPAIAHAGSVQKLLGLSASPERIQAFSMERQVTAQTPRTFIVHAADDNVVKVANALRMFEALQAQGVPSELIVFPAGGHGFGLNNATTRDRWIERCRDWLVSNGFVRSEELDEGR